MHAMQRQILVTMLTFFCVNFLQAQLVQTPPSNIAINGKWADQIFISDVNGMPIRNKYPDVNGSPFFNAAYKYANLELTDGKRFAGVKIKIDLVSQETVFLAANGVEAIMGMGMVKEINYLDTTAEGVIPYKFATGFPAIDNQTAGNYYQVLANGKCSLVKSLFRKVAEKKSEMSGEISKEFESYENVYLFKNGVMKRLKKDKDFVLAELADKQQPVYKFFLDKKINVKNTDQLIQLINYYNTL